MRQTSLEAFESIKPLAVTKREEVYEFLKKNGPMTDEEIQNGLDMNPSTQRPRRIELEAEGRVVAAGYGVTKAGRKAIIWMAV